MIKYYELTYLVPAGITEKELEDFSKKISSLVSEKCKITKSEIPTKTALCYQIKKKNTAYLLTIEFEAEAEIAESIKKELEKETTILRFLLIKRISPEKIKQAPKKRTLEKAHELK